MATSYNGWTASPSPAAIGIDTGWSVLGTRPFASGGFPGGVKSGPVAIVFRHLVTRLHNEVEPMMRGDSGELGYGCWGYSYRANVNNPSVLSCHASGTAIDYNAPRHPNGTSVGPNGGGGWTREQAAKIREILADLGGVVRWLSGNDPMHFEINASAERVALVASGLADPGKPGKPNKPTDPIDPIPTDPEDDMPYTEQQIKELVRGGVKWALEDIQGIDPLIIKAAVGAGVDAAVSRIGEIVRAEVARVLPRGVQADPDQHQAAKELVHDGAKWALEDPNVDVSRFPGAATKS